MSKIKDIQAYTIFDSRGYPTIECLVILDSGVSGRGIAPSGASTGKYEALELRDKIDTRFGGKSVDMAINHILTTIRPPLIGKEIADTNAIDQMLIGLDGTRNKARLGSNALVAVSMACVHAAAEDQSMTIMEYLAIHSSTQKIIPLPQIQMIGGGAHSDGRIDIQDFLIIATGAESLMQCYQMTFDVYRHTGYLLKKRGLLAGVADEGGYWPQFERNEAVFEILLQAIESAGYTPGREVSLALDVAASEFYQNGGYYWKLEDRWIDPDQYFDIIDSWLGKYPICSIEDPFAEDDLTNWQKLTSRWGDKVQIIGDDLYVTQKQRIEMGQSMRWSNSVLIKPNQVGTVMETLNAISTTRQMGWYPVISARSGETEDTFIAHLSTGMGAGQLKVGSFSRSERMAKWNELLRLENLYKKTISFANAVMQFAWKANYG